MATERTISQFEKDAKILLAGVTLFSHRSDIASAMQASFPGL
jgi:hypothetical protein